MRKFGELVVAGTVGALVVATIWWAVGGDSFRKKEIQITDQMGRTRLTLGVSGGDLPYLAMYDAAGKQRLRLQSLSQGEPELFLSDARGHKRMQLEMLRDNVPHLNLYDSTGERRLEMSMMTDGSMMLMSDASGEMRAVRATNPH